MKSKKQKLKEEYDYLYGDLSEYPSWGVHRDSFMYYYDIDYDLLNEGLGISQQVYDIASFFSFFINLFHLLILTRKELRSNLIYIIMIGICVCDILQSFGNVTKVVMTWNILYEIEPCFGAVRYAHLMVDTVAKTWQIMSRRCSGLLALYIAMFRALAVIFPMSELVEIMSSPKCGFLVMVLVAVASGGWSSVYFVKTKFRKASFCGSDYSSEDGEMWMPSYTPYNLVTRKTWEMKYFMVDGLMAFFVSIVYLIMAAALFLAVWKVSRKRKNVTNPKSTANTSALVIVMALTFFFSEAAYGFMYFANFTVFRTFDDGLALRQFETFPLTLQILNSCIHCFTCFCMSAQYRGAVGGLFFCCRKEEKSTVFVPQSMMSRTSAASSVFSKRSY